MPMRLYVLVNKRVHYKTPAFATVRVTLLVKHRGDRTHSKATQSRP